MTSHLHHAPALPHGRAISLTPNGALRAPSRSRTPHLTASTLHAAPESEQSHDDDPRSRLFTALFARSESRVSALFGDGEGPPPDDTDETSAGVAQGHVAATEAGKGHVVPQKRKAARQINEDDYDDSEEEEENNATTSPLKSRSTGSTAIPRVLSPSKALTAASGPASTSAQGPTSQGQGRSADDVRKRLEEDRKAAEDAARKSFHTYFYPIDNDRDAMLEQQRLEESDRQIDAEMSGTSNANQAVEGTLSQANLGTSSLVLKHLIARIDAKRDQVRASDQELRNLMVEVKKNRSKWANEERIGQEELYEAAEKVLSEIKAQTSHSQPFLQRVNKREAPDYYNIIKHPMDLGQMTKKLKQFTYKSKQEFVDDLNLIWSNCFKYNADPNHHLRKNAEAMRKTSNALIPLIPDIVIRDRAEVEAEERRLHATDGDLEGADDSDDEPIISSRGRQAPAKKAKKGANSRKALPNNADRTPGAEGKPNLVNGQAGPRHEFLRADSDTAMEGSQNGFNTPPPGTITPAGLNGATVSSQADPTEVDVIGASVNGVGGLIGPQVDYEDTLYKMWKQVTKKDRATVTAERHRLFKGDKINPEEPAILRSRAGMRRWARNQRETESGGVLGKRKRDGSEDEDGEPSGETLAEGMEETEERVLPDYYDPVSAIPDLEPRLQWKEDSEGFVVPACEEALRIAPKGFFTSPDSSFSQKMTANLRQMQETRKVCTKIGVVKQMQLQSQMYQNQFQKYEAEPFQERDVEPFVVSDTGPVMSPYLCRAAMQRSVSQIFYNAGFEECQPSALDAMTDIASGYFQKLTRSFTDYMNRPKVVVQEPVPGTDTTRDVLKPKFAPEECTLQSLSENGIELEALDAYVKDDVDRLNSKLGTLHERMKSHLAELLRPALSADAGPDGVNAFHDGSEQFVGGDFAEDLDEDFFGFKELGLDKEFGLASLSVPLHLLQSRMHSTYQAQNTSATSIVASTFPAPPTAPPVTIQSLPNEIGLVQNFFFAKLHANNDAPLVEDEELPQKQRLPKPRLPPTGKITSPRKKPVREAGPGKGHPKKKMRLVEGQGWVKESELAERERQAKEKEERAKAAAAAAPGTRANGVGMERTESRTTEMDLDEEGERPGPVKKLGKITGESGMISPESLEAS